MFDDVKHVSTGRSQNVFSSLDGDIIPTPNHNIMVAGFPCQDLSALNQDRMAYSTGIAHEGAAIHLRSTI
eukprot:7333137-Pyramimonas_sp.AAC.1